MMSCYVCFVIVVLLCLVLVVLSLCFFFFKQKTAYEMRISDWSSDVCSSDLHRGRRCDHLLRQAVDALHVVIPLLDRQRLGPRRAVGIADRKDCEIGRASCRERVCQ